MPNNNTDLQRQAISKIKQINKKLKAYEDLGLKGYALKEVRDILYMEDLSIYTKNKNLSASKATLSSYSEPRLKDFVLNLDKVLKNDNFRTKKAFVKFVENKKEQIKNMDDAKTATFDNTMRLRHGEQYEHLLKYIYKGNKKSLYIDYITLMEGEMADVVINSDLVFDYMYKQHEIDIKRSIEEEATKRTEKHFGLMTEEDIKQKKARLDKIRGRRGNKK